MALFLIIPTAVLGQEAGNRSYGAQRRRPQPSSGVLTGVAEGKGQVYFIEANVLANVKPDNFVAVFGLVLEGTTSAESNDKVNSQVSGFIKDMDGLGIKRGDIFVDFINQNKVYDFTTTGNTVTEKFSGFETKKNIAVRYKDRELLEKILSAAATRSIFDLIEIDYVVGDMKGVQGKLYDEAVRVIKQKEANYLNAFGIKLASTNVAAEKYDAFYPGELYSGYQAFESGTTSGDYNRVVVRQRKTSTFFYQPLDGSSFDSVVSQMGLEPMVQFTLYLKIQYDLKK